MHCGDTLLMPIRPTGGLKAHLWILITEPLKDGTCVIVNITTLKGSKADRTVVLQAGDHVFIKHPSFVRYSDAGFANAKRLFKDIAGKSASGRPALSQPVLERVQVGLLNSPYTQNAVLEFCKDQWGIK